MIDDVNFKTYQSPFSWRYGSHQMREIFSEINKRKMWRRVWVALAQAQQKYGLLDSEDLEAIKKFQDRVDISKAHEIEKELKHDLMAELKTFASQIGKAGGKLHLGATSQDIEDNSDVMIIDEALVLIEEKLRDLLLKFAKRIEENKSLVCMAYTHLQPAEPTTLGYRFASYAQDLLNDLEQISFFQKNLKGKGIKGAVGTSASYKALVNQNVQKMEKEVMEKLQVVPFEVSTQVYSRKQDYHLVYALNSIAISCHKFAFDLRLMQSPGFGEWMEPFSSKQVGSSAMPFKRNPIVAEKICALARYVNSLVNLSAETAANNLLERTLDDSAARRIFLPEAFLALDEILTQTQNIIEGLIINKNNIKKNLEKHGPFAATEALMMEAVKRGADRQGIHERLREISMASWQELEKGKPNPLVDLLKNDKMITKFIKIGQVEKFIDPASYVGLSSTKCQQFLEKLNKVVKK